MPEVHTKTVDIGPGVAITRVVNHKGETMKLGTTQYGTFLPKPGQRVTVTVAFDGVPQPIMGEWVASAQAGKYPAFQVRVRAEDEVDVAEFAPKAV